MGEVKSGLHLTAPTRHECIVILEARVRYKILPEVYQV